MNIKCLLLGCKFKVLSVKRNIRGLNVREVEEYNEPRICDVGSIPSLLENPLEAILGIATWADDMVTAIRTSDYTKYRIETPYIVDWQHCTCERCGEVGKIPTNYRPEMPEKIGVRNG